MRQGRDMNRNDPPRVSRRTFVKSAALVGAPVVFIPRRTDLSEGGFEYHPLLNPLRVAGIHDRRMTIAAKPTCSWRAQDRLVNREIVEKDIDILAARLTEEKIVEDAWKAIFLKPPGKAWSDVTVAVKTNNLGLQHTRSAVMGKICKVLTGLIGVKPSRVFIYDASHGRDMSRKSPFAGLPDGVNVAADWGGFKGKARLGRPYKEGEAETACLDPLARGQVDILVNIAMCKGHHSAYGGFTMCMKNHLGTFDPGPAHREDETDYLIAVNKTPLILGDMDQKRKKVLFPRQQLCLVDAIWASEKGPLGFSSAQPNRLFMGTFAPAVDYLVAKCFRKRTARWPVQDKVADRFLHQFGFSPADFPEGEKIIDAAY